MVIYCHDPTVSILEHIISSVCLCTHCMDIDKCVFRDDARREKVSDENQGRRYIFYPVHNLRCVERINCVVSVLANAIQNSANKRGTLLVRKKHV